VGALRIGLIGAGANTRDRHIPGFLSCPEVAVIAVANRSRASATAVAERFGIERVYDTPAELLADHDVDAVCIGTWPYRHRDFTVAALAAGKHVLCEARMAGNLDDALAMADAASRAPGLVAQLVPAPFDFRLGPTITRMIAQGELGDIYEVTVTSLNGAGIDPGTPLHWRQRSDYSGKNVMNLGILQETVQRWLGDTTRVVAHGAITVPERLDPETGQSRAVDIPDSYTVAAEMACGACATYHVSAVAPGAPPAGISVYGSRATIHWTMDGRARFIARTAEPVELEPDAGTDRGWQVESDFVRSIRDGAPVTLTSFPDGVKYMRFIDAAWESWKTGKAKTLA
jgi:predicted dehydrogenase